MQLATYKSMLTKASNDLAKSRQLVGLLKQQIEQGDTELSEELDKANERISMLSEDFMTYFRERLGPVMLERIRQCVYTQNDESRIVVRSRESKEDKFKYNVECINSWQVDEIVEEDQALFFLWRNGSASSQLCT